jgi:predicted dehydrogenase
MQTAVKKSQVKTIVSFVLRWNPLFQMLKRMTRDDTFGEIYSVETDYQSYCGDWWGGFPMGRTVAMGGSAFLTAGCHAIDALRWFAAQDEYSAADPAEVFAYQGGKRGQSTRQYNPLTNDWHEGDPLEFPGLEMALVKFSNGVLGKVSANFECIQPYALPIEIFGDKGTVKDNKVWSHKYPGQKDWIELPTICPDNADVSHHPFQGEIDHFVDCVRHDQESHCNLDDAAKTHEIVFGAFKSYRTGQPVKLPLAIES